MTLAARVAEIRRRMSANGVPTEGAVSMWSTWKTERARLVVPWSQAGKRVSGVLTVAGDENAEPFLLIRGL